MLDQMAVYAQNVVLNDSLLRLADMPEAERLKVIDGIIERLKKKEAEEAEDAKREEYLAQQAAAGSNLNTSGANAPQEFTLNADRSWYFYNTATRNAGRTDFQRRWGSRKLEDDWRRRNKATFSLDADDENADDDDAADEADVAETDGAADAQPEGEGGNAESAARASDPHFREYYLKQIPSNDVERATAHDVIQEGLYNSALILKDRLEDFTAARAEWDKLLSRYPDNIYRLDVYHNLYLMYMRMERPDLAEPWRQLIISDFPASPYAEAMRDPDYIGRLRGMERDQQQMYEQAYDDYLNDRNAAVHQARERVEKEYPLSPLMPKFMFLDALAYVTDNKSEQFGQVLRDLLDRYPDADIAPLAAAWHQGLSSGRELHSTGSNTRGMLWDIRLSNDSTILMGENPQIEFTLAPDEPHYLVLLFPTDEIQPAQLLYEVARHNFSTYVVKDFDLEVMNFGPLGVLVIKGFDNQAQLNHYRSVMTRDGSLTIPAQVRPVEISKSNFEQLLNGGGSFDDYFRFIGEETVRSTHEAVLPPDEYPSAEEMYDDSEDDGPDEAGSADAVQSGPHPQDEPQSASPVPDSTAVSPDSTTVTTATMSVKSDTIAAPPVTPPAKSPAKTPAKVSADKPATPPAGKNGKAPVKDNPVTTQPVTLPDYPLGSEGDEDD
ncbi:MAG: hypothetical protein K2K92_03720 [Duncaniella sp.]|nr:hypothetical protein [Duncaniella sp.]